MAVSLGLLAAQGLGIAETAPALETARVKLERVMPARLKQQAQALSESARLELPSARAPSRLRDALSEQAVRLQRLAAIK